MLCGVIDATLTERLHETMPLFSNRFSPKGANPRRSEATVQKDNENGKSTDQCTDEEQQIRLRLGDQEAVFDFDTGQWIPETGPVSGAHKENVQLRKNVEKLEEENNLLRVKFELLLDMLAQTTAEAHIQERELNHLKNQIEEMKSHNRRKV